MDFPRAQSLPPAQGKVQRSAPRPPVEAAVPPPGEGVGRPPRSQQICRSTAVESLLHGRGLYPEAVPILTVEEMMPKKSGAKKKPNAAFMKPMQPDEALGAVVGSKPLPRTQITKKIWTYIKKHKLQDEKNRRMINADEKLALVFGKKRQVSMFEMTKLVSGHMS